MDRDEVTPYITEDHDVRLRYDRNVILRTTILHSTNQIPLKVINNFHI